MVRFTFTVKDPLGMHAKTAGIFVKEALKYTEEEVIVRFGDKQGNAKLIFHVMTLNIKGGDQVEILVSGPNERQTAASLQAFYEANI